MKVIDSERGAPSCFNLKKNLMKFLRLMLVNAIYPLTTKIAVQKVHCQHLQGLKVLILPLSLCVI